MAHTHDDRYYTESEVNNLLAAKQDANTAITTHNIGSQSVNYANGANYATNSGNADTLDGYHAASFTFLGGRQNLATRVNLFRQGNFRHLTLGASDGMASIATILSVNISAADRPIDTRLGFCYIVLDDNTTAYLGTITVKNDGSITISAKKNSSGKVEAITSGNVRGEIGWCIG